MDLKTAERLFTGGAILCFLVLIFLILGEVLGWWNDAGEIAITITTIIGALLAGIAILVNATRDQARRIATGVQGNGRKLDVLHNDMDTLHEDMGTLVGGQERQTEILVEIRDRL